MVGVGRGPALVVEKWRGVRAVMGASQFVSLSGWEGGAGGPVIGASIVLVFPLGWLPFCFVCRTTSSSFSVWCLLSSVVLAEGGEPFIRFLVVAFLLVSL